jgi:uncharacterized protein DUF3761
MRCYRGSAGALITFKILLAVLGAGIWTSNALSVFAPKNAPPVNTIAAPSPTPNVIEIYERRQVQIQASGGAYPRPYGATAVCADGAYSYAANRHGACSQHGGAAQWLSH